MYEFKIVSESKVIKRVANIKCPHKQITGKIDPEDLLNSSLPTEIYAIGTEGMEKLRRGKKVTVIRVIKTTIYINKL